jgi:flagellar hook capping protein FlgD
MRRAIVLSIATLGLLARLAAAEPRISVTYFSGVPIIQLTGDFTVSSYTVYRAAAAGDPDYRLIFDSRTLCIGQCAAADYEAEPGQTYLYRFDLALPGGSFQSFGPYPVTIRRQVPVSATIWPNPGRGTATISIALGGRPGDPPVETEVALYDLQGRALRTLHRGPLARGTTALTWDGRDGSGRRLGSGLYFLHVRSAAGDLTARIVRTY